MQAHLECILCFQRQALEAARFAGADEATQERTLRRVMDELRRAEWNARPPEIAHAVHAVVREAVGDGDPYLTVKRESNARALALLPGLRQRVAAASDPLRVAVRIAIAGNIIDFGAHGAKYDLEQTIEEVLERPFAIDDYAALTAALTKASRLVYLADNAGEIVFDRLLLETLRERFAIGEVIFVVKGGPIINDATHEDAEAVGFGGLPGLRFDVMGTGAPGTGPERNSAEFGALLDSADVVISKGQGNYEAFSERDDIFFLLMAKCPVVAASLGAEPGDIVLTHGGVRS